MSCSQIPEERLVYYDYFDYDEEILNDGVLRGGVGV